MSFGECSRAILITGIAGGIGRHLGRFLRARGYVVVGLDIQEPSPGCYDEFYQVDILELPVRDPFLPNCCWDAVIHLAAIRAPTETSEERILEVNVIGTYKVLRWAAHHRIPKVIFMSSEAVLGFAFAKRNLKPKYVPIDEQHPIQVHDAYGLSKLLGEEIARAFHFETGAMVFCLRPPWVWIPEEAGYYRWLIKHPQEWAHGLWAYVVIEDLCDAIERAIRYDGSPGYYVFFVAANDVGVPIPSRQLLRCFYDFQGPIKKGFGEYDSVISSRALQHFLGWQPRWSWRFWLQTILGGAIDDR